MKTTSPSKEKLPLWQEGERALPLEPNGNLIPDSEIEGYGKRFEERKKEEAGLIELGELPLFDVPYWNDLMAEGPAVWAALRRRLTELLAEGGLAAKARQSAASLSGGEAQRLAILRALATGPRVLFLDEPTSSLDPAATQAIEALILSAAAQGVRIVMVTHDIGQARRLGHDIVLMQGGGVAEHALADAFFDAPQTQAARRYLAGALVL